MCFFGRRKPTHAPSTSAPTTVSTFVEATGGGWSEPPDVVAADGGSQADYVASQLELARDAAQNVSVGESFEFTLSDIPAGINSPHEIVFGLLTRGNDYGLRVDAVLDETMFITRIS